MKKIYKAIQPLLIRLNSFRIFNRLGRFYYLLGLRIFLSVLKKFPEIKLIYLVSSVATGEWIPWVSDIDLTVIIKDMDTNKEIKFLHKFWRIYRILRLPFPFINHLDLFNVKEFSSEILYNEPQLNYLIKDLQLVYGQDYRKTINYDSNNISSFRIHDWMQFMRWLYEDTFNGKTYIRKYYRVFNKILYFSQKDDINAKNLRNLLSYAETSNFWLENPEQFVLKGFYYSINILNGVYKRPDNKQTTFTRFQIVDIDKKYPPSFLESTKMFVDSLLPVINYIKSVFVDPGSIQNNHRRRIWIILKDDIKQKDFLELVSLIKKNAIFTLNDEVFPYIFTEGALNLFLNTQRLWTFEYFHIQKHAKVVFGEDILNRLDRPSDVVLIRMVNSSVLVYKNRLRNMVNNQNIPEVIECLLNILSLKLLLEKNIIVTTAQELINTYNEYYNEKETVLLMNFINRGHIDKSQLHSILKSILDDLSNRYSRANKHISESTVSTLLHET